MSSEINLAVLGQAIDVLAGERKKCERLLRAEDEVRRALEALRVIGPIAKRVEAEQQREAAAIEHADGVVAAQAARAVEAGRVFNEQQRDRDVTLAGKDEQIRQRDARLVEQDRELAAGEIKLAKIKAAIQEAVA